MNILTEIFEKRMAAVNHEKRLISPEEMIVNARSSRIPRPVLPLFQAGHAKLIAELKCASPSAGTITTLSDEQYCQIARDYLDNGASMLSVLTEPDFFGGSDERLKLARQAFPYALILMKDFIVDDYQIAKARVLGADAILLIAAMLTDDQLARFYRFAASLGVTVLTEVHNLAELRRAEAMGAAFIGVNNRDLKTMKVSLATSETIIGHAPAGAVLISESGFRTAADISKIAALGYRGFLVGEKLMRSPTPGVLVKSFVEATTMTTTKTKETKPKVKFCGITNLQDALFAETLGVDYLGFVFAPESPRYIEPQAAAEITKKLSKETALVGVFVNEDSSKVNEIAAIVGLNFIQLHGDEDSSYAETIIQPLFRSARTIDEVEAAAKLPKQKLAAIIVDGFHPEKRGGTGTPFDRQTAASAANAANVIVAGGLSPDNVAAVIAAIKPYAVDVSSGIERSPGRKDPVKMTAFMTAVRSSHEL